MHTLILQLRLQPTPAMRCCGALSCSYWRGQIGDFDHDVGLPAGLHTALLHAPSGVSMSVVVTSELAFGPCGLPAAGAYSFITSAVHFLSTFSVYLLSTRSIPCQCTSS